MTEKIKNQPMPHRRPTCQVDVGELTIGSAQAVALQSMANVSTMNLEACINQAERCAELECSLFRYTAQGVREAKQLQEIVTGIRAKGYQMPIVADIHFSSAPAFEALKYVDKVRINPGNFIETPGRGGALHLTEAQEREMMEANQRKSDELLSRFIKEAQSRKRALRIGVNHGSLSHRILKEYGNTPEGMVASALEYVDACYAEGFDQIVISMKSSNVIVMTTAVRLLVEQLDARNQPQPLHLGVTEAGAGEDGRIKSAIGIGSLMMDGMGDTIRVSLSEEPEEELKFGKRMISYIQEGLAKTTSYKAYEPLKRFDIDPHNRFNAIAPTPLIMHACSTNDDALEICCHDDGSFTYQGAAITVERIKSDADSPELVAQKVNESSADAVILSAEGFSALYQWRAIYQHLSAGRRPALILSYRNDHASLEQLQMEAAIQLGAILLQGAGEGICIESSSLEAEDLRDLMNQILQAVRLKMSHTEFISCPGCGRTLFDLQETVATVKKNLSHLKNLKIGVMGCVVNGPGEMADADYGYVGSQKGKVDLYRGQELIKKGVPDHEAVEQLSLLIKEDGKWQVNSKK